MAEARILNDPNLPEIVIPLIDFDLESDAPVWIHTEYAEPISQKRLETMLFSPDNDVRNTIGYALWLAGVKNSPYALTPAQFNSVLDRMPFSDKGREMSRMYAEQLADLASSFDLDLHDFINGRNWGLYNNKPVVIDLGFTNEVAKLYRL